MTWLARWPRLFLRWAKVLAGRSYYHQPQRLGKAFRPREVAGYFNDLTAKTRWPGTATRREFRFNVLADGHRVYFARRSCRNIFHLLYNLHGRLYRASKEWLTFLQARSGARGVINYPDKKPFCTAARTRRLWIFSGKSHGRGSAERDIILVGAYPPPYGGNSVHLARVCARLRLANVRFRVIDPYNIPCEEDKHNYPNEVFRFKGNAIQRLLRSAVALSRICEGNVVHFHTSAFARFIWVAPIFILASRKCVKRIVTIHSGSFKTTVSSWPKILQWVLTIYLQNMDLVVVVNTEQEKYLRAIGVNIPIKVLPAFLPPDADSTVTPDGVTKLREYVDIVLVTSGYCTPLYRYEDVIVAATTLQEEYALKIGLIICCYSVFNREYYSKIKRMISEFGTGLFLENLNPDEFLGVLRIADIYVRATTMEGDAVSIREAGFLGKKVIASNVVRRPRGVLVYQAGDIQGLKECIKIAYETNRGRLEPEELIDRSGELLELYTN